jgi:hypothetical protein
MSSARFGFSRLARITLGCLALIASTATCDDPTAPLPREGPPDDLRFVFGGFAITGVTLELQGATVLMWRQSWDPRPGEAIDTLRATPSAEQWRDFWSAADAAGVQRWRARYAAEDVIDGNAWQLRLVAGAFALESTGSNAYPDRLGREQEALMTAEFRALLTALGNLVGEPLLATLAEVRAIRATAS